MLRMGSAAPPVPHILSWHILGQLYLVLFLVSTLRMGRAIPPVPHIAYWVTIKEIDTFNIVLK